LFNFYQGFTSGFFYTLDMQTFSLKSLSFAVLGFLLFGVSYAQTNLSVEQRLAQLERAVANLEEYALLLRYNQIGSVADFDERINQLERSFTYIIGEIVQLQPSSTSGVTQNVVGTSPQTTPTSSYSSYNTSYSSYNPSTASYGTTSVTTTTPTTTLPTTTVTTPTTTTTTTTTAASTTGSSQDLIYLQVGAYNNPATAAAARRKVETLGYNIYESSSGQIIRLFLGPFRSSDIPTMRAWLAQQGIDSFPIR